MRSAWNLAITMAATIAFTAAALAGDPVPLEFEPALVRAHTLVENEKWAEGEAALRRLFVDFEGGSGVRAHLRAIEEDLKVCVFRRCQPPLTGADLFGRAAERFNAATRDVELTFKELSPPLWTSDGEGLRWLDVRLEGSVTIETLLSYVGENKSVASVFLCYDVEKRGGYAVLPGVRLEEAETVLTAPAKILKIQAAGAKELAVNAIPDARKINYHNTWLNITRTGSEIVAKVGGAVVVRASDPMYTTGYVGVFAEVRMFRVKGRIDRHAYRKLVGEHFASQFAAWEDSAWKRDAEIPEWARATKTAVDDATFAELPGDAPQEELADLAALATEAADGDSSAILEATAEALGAPPNTAQFLRAAAALGAGRWKAAADGLDLLVAAEPKLAPARLYRAKARFRLRRLDEARNDFEWVIVSRPACGAAYSGLALLDIFAHDLPAAAAMLARAAEAGVSGEEIDQVREWVHRASRGPKLAQRFEHETDHFVVVSDHSKKVCFDTATLLEKMQPQYAVALGPAQQSPAKSRVYVLSGREGYLDYAEGLGHSLEQSSGAYLPMLRELVLWIPIDMTSYAHTTRHEGLHQYMHRLVEDAPNWFNEGYAEVMGGGGPEGLRDERRDGAIVKQFMPVSRLVAMKQPEFMKNAAVCYTQSRYLVDFLRRTKHEKLRKLLQDYFAAIAGGLSQDEANAKVLTPVMAALEAEFKQSK